MGQRIRTDLHKPFDLTLSALAIGSLELTPSFDSGVTVYTAETTNASDEISTTATDTEATVEIMSDDATIADDGTATWGMKNAPILILDDSVSAVDVKTEKAILENLANARAGKTTILIAHRISTIEDMDKIIFIDNGRVVAVGDHATLISTCPEYKSMVDLQKLDEEHKKSEEKEVATNV